MARVPEPKKGLEQDATNLLSLILDKEAPINNQRFVCHQSPGSLHSFSNTAQLHSFNHSLSSIQSLPRYYPIFLNIRYLLGRTGYWDGLQAVFYLLEDTELHQSLKKTTNRSMQLKSFPKYTQNHQVLSAVSAATPSSGSCSAQHAPEKARAGEPFVPWSEGKASPSSRGTQDTGISKFEGISF